MIREVCEQILRLLRPDLDSKYQKILFWYFLWYLLVLKCNPWIYFLIVKGPLDSILIVYSKPAQLQKLLTAPVNLGAMARWLLNMTLIIKLSLKLNIGISVNNMHLLDIQMGKLILYRCSNRDAEEHEEKNSIWLKEADLSTLSVDKEVTKQEQEWLNSVKRKRFKMSSFQALKKAEEVLKKKQDKKEKAVGC